MRHQSPADAVQRSDSTVTTSSTEPADDALAGLDATTVTVLRALLALAPDEARAIRSRVARRRAHRTQHGPRSTYGEQS